MSKVVVVVVVVVMVVVVVVVRQAWDAGYLCVCLLSVFEFPAW